ncbi:MAG: TIGR04255 family protein [Acaryochloris sp. RU_4_1]|nr:TIGR04255 family protein [Acaryochloris sp. RU_4_1]NJR57264.1 TIGR04255 family protein [Acaryochloris sp. CRU_2_0]
MQHTHYSKAPIIEAVIDLKVKPPSEESISALENLAIGYSERRPLMTLQGQIQGGQSVAATASQAQTGYQYISEDQKQIFQAQQDSFTFSRLAPYQDWISFCDEAKRLWDIYVAAINPESISRVAVRYINRLDLPLPLNDFKDYLQTVPEVSPGLPQGLSNFFLQLEIPQEDLSGTLVLNETLIPSSSSDLISVVLDIDLFSVDRKD